VDTADPSPDQAATGSVAEDALADGEATTLSRAKNNAKRRRRERDDDDNDVAEQGLQQSKRTRFKSPQKPSSKKSTADPQVENTAKKENEDEESGDEGSDAEMKDKGIEGKAAAPVGDNSKEDEGEDDQEEDGSDAKKKSASIQRKKVNPPMQKLRVPSHQTPGKFATNEGKVKSFDEPTTEMPVPSRRLVFNATPAPTANSENIPDASSPATAIGQPQITVNANVNGESNSPVQIEPHEQDQDGAQDQPSKLFWLAKPWVWFLVILALHAACYPRLADHVLPKLVETSSSLLLFYKGALYSVVPPPKKMVVNQTHLEELNDAALKRREGKRKALEDLQKQRKLLKEGILKMQADSRDMEEDFKAMEERIEMQGEPMNKLHDRLSVVDISLRDRKSDGLDETKSLQDIRKVMNDNDEAKLLDLSSLDLWVIPEMPEHCQGNVEGPSSSDLGEVEEIRVVPAITQDRLDEWTKDLEEMVIQSTDEIFASDEVANEVRQWIKEEVKKGVDWDKALSKFTVEELGAMVKKEKINTVAQGGSQSAEMIISLVQARLELEIADQTGRFDYASVRNGASIIREGPRATSRGLVEKMPLLNRLLAHVGLKFYGHRAEAALTPTNPQGTLGQCWSFQSEETLAKSKKTRRLPLDFSRGTVATLAVRLARPAYVHSVIIEHPPREITDRIESAIRGFRVIGYEDTLAKEGPYELGRFEYKIGKGYVFVTYRLYDTELTKCRLVL